MKVSVLHLGCKVNQAECSDIQAGLVACGHRLAGLSDKPDLCIINTCSVTAKSDYQSRQLIRRAHGTGARVIVTGCYADLNKEAVAQMVGVDRVFANSEKSSIVKEIAGFAGGETASLPFSMRSRFSLKVQDGCNYSCSYCLIPKARGRSRSLPIETIVRRAEELSSQYEEIVLTGIHLGTYGYDICPKVSLAHLLGALLRTPIARIRLSSLEITEIGDDLLELLSHERVCSHLHIPLQSGDDRILGLMNRNYTTKRYASGVERLSQHLPNASLGSDVIAGFPTENRADFQRTYDLIESTPLTYLHVFPYSARPGTAAVLLRPQVTQSEKRQRCAGLSELGKQKRSAFMQAQVGKVLDPLLEAEDGDGHLLGTTGNYLKVRVSADPYYLKKIVSVRITGFKDDILFGVLINTS